jgi:hypothetical protein
LVRLLSKPCSYGWLYRFQYCTGFGTHQDWGD